MMISTHPARRTPSCGEAPALCDANSFAELAAVFYSMVRPALSLHMSPPHPPTRTSTAGTGAGAVRGRGSSHGFGTRAHTRRRRRRRCRRMRRVCGLTAPPLAPGASAVGQRLPQGGVEEGQTSVLRRQLRGSREWYAWLVLVAPRYRRTAHGGLCGRPCTAAAQAQCEVGVTACTVGCGEPTRTVPQWPPNPSFKHHRRPCVFGAAVASCGGWRLTVTCWPATVHSAGEVCAH
jgi:hypothetical protein